MVSSERHKQMLLRLDVRRKFFNQRTARGWHCHPEKLEALQARLVGALCSLSWGGGSPAHVWGKELGGL